MSFHHKLYTTRCLSPLAYALSLAFSTSYAYADNNDDNTGHVETIVITASQTEHSQLDAPATVTVITREELAEKPVQDLLDALRGSSGLSFIGRQVGGRRVLSLRGMESRHSLFLIDGQRVSASDDVFGHSDFQYDWIPLDAIERIEIVRGPLSSLYGSEALGGVINIITRQHLDKVSGNLSVRAGNEQGGGDSHSIGGQLNLPLHEKLSLRIEANRGAQDAVADQDDATLDIFEAQEQSQAAATFSWFPQHGHRLDLNLLTGNEERWMDTNNYGAPPVYRNTYELNRDQHSLRYRFDSTEFAAELRHYRTELSQENRKTQGFTPTATQVLIDEINDGHVTWSGVNQHVLTLGAEQREETLEHPAFVGGEDSAGQNAVYVQDEWQLATALNLTVGVRRDDHDMFGGETSPRAYLVWRPAEHVSVKTGFGGGFRAPSLKQVSPDYRFIGPHSFVGNGDLKPERSDSRELGVEFDNDSSHARVTVFSNDIDDLIGTVCIENCTAPRGRVFQYVNLEQARIRGAELEGGHRFGEKWELTANYAYLDGHNTATDKPLPERPRHTLNLALNYHGEQLNSALRNEYLGEQSVYTTTAVETLPTYNVWHLDLGWRVSADWQIRGGVSNLTDVDLAEKSELFSYLEHGRRYWLGLNASF